MLQCRHHGLNFRCIGHDHKIHEIYMLRTFAHIWYSVPSMFAIYGMAIQVNIDINNYNLHFQGYGIIFYNIFRMEIGSGTINSVLNSCCSPVNVWLTSLINVHGKAVDTEIKFFYSLYQTLFFHSK